MLELCDLVGLLKGIGIRSSFHIWNTRHTRRGPTKICRDTCTWHRFVPNLIHDLPAFPIGVAYSLAILMCKFHTCHHPLSPKSTASAHPTAQSELYIHAFTSRISPQKAARKATNSHTLLTHCKVGKSFNWRSWSEPVRLRSSHGPFAAPPERPSPGTTRSRAFSLARGAPSDLPWSPCISTSIAAQIRRSGELCRRATFSDRRPTDFELCRRVTPENWREVEFRRRSWFLAVAIAEGIL